MGDSSFKPPSWAAPPQCRAWLEVRRDGDAADAPVATVRVDGAPFTTFGRSAEACDVHVDDRRVGKNCLSSSPDTSAAPRRVCTPR